MFVSISVSVLQNTNLFRQFFFPVMQFFIKTFVIVYSNIFFLYCSKTDFRNLTQTFFPVLQFFH